MFKFQDITLRKVEREDLHQLLNLKSESWGTTHRTTIANIEDQNRWFDSLDKDVHTPKNLMLMAYSANFGMPFGVFKISEVDWASRNCSAAWDVFKECRGMGYGKPLVIAGTAFCFDVLNLSRINCEILETNIASRKCAEAAGFQHEGLKRAAVLKRGKYLNSVVYGALFSDFAALQFGPNTVK